MYIYVYIGGDSGEEVSYCNVSCKVRVKPPTTLSVTGGAQRMLVLSLLALLVQKYKY